MNNKIPKEYTSIGTLIISVHTANGAIPIEDAIVTVRGANQSGSGVINVLYTDQSGNTPRISLPAPPQKESESPGGITPFAKYNVDVAKEGFYPKSFLNVPIFANTTSIQPVNMIPKTEYEGKALIPNDGIVTESQNPKL